MLFENFEAFIRQKKLLTHNAKILLAVSGGVDSMVMMHLFHRKGMQCSVAHCNFQLRGAESDGDEQFVSAQANRLGFSIFISRFDTKSYAAENKLSIQMAARELRYAWFDKLVKVQENDKIAVAHNKDDNLETFLINLSRSSGIAGLTGIHSSSGNIIRPLLFASRETIMKYAKDQDIDFREDSSNASDKYLRNYLRHNIIPAMQKAVPHFSESVAHCMENLTEVNKIYDNTINLWTKSIVKHEKDTVTIDIAQLVSSASPQSVLFEVLKPYHFHSAVIDEILQAADAISGKQFFSSTHRLVKDRNNFIVTHLKTSKNFVAYIEKELSELAGPVNLIINKFEKSNSFTVEKTHDTAQLDFHKLEFPLMLRHWQKGDYFVPLGMKGMKKVSDFFIDMKLSLAEKENTWLLLSGGQIAWILGKRIDNRFRITETTTHIYSMTIKDPG